MATGTATTGQDPEDQRSSTNPWGVPLPWSAPGRNSVPPPASPTPPWGAPIVVARDAPQPGARPDLTPPPLPGPPSLPGPGPLPRPAPLPGLAPGSGPGPGSGPAPRQTFAPLPVLAPVPGPGAASGPPPFPPAALPPSPPLPPAPRRGSRTRTAVVATFTVLGLTAASSWGYIGYEGLFKARTIAASPFARQTTPAAASASALPSASPSDGEVPVAVIQSQVAALQAAVTSGDENAFVKSVDPQATTFLAHWRSVFQGIKRVGLSGVTFAVEAERVEDWDHDGYARAAFAPVAIRYSIAGFDPKPVVTVVGLTWGWRNGSWWLVDDEGGETRLPLGAFYEPWLIGDVGVARRPHVVVVGDVNRKADNERLASSMERAVQAVRAAIPGGPWNGTVVAFASTDKKFVNAWFGTQAATRTSGEPKEPATIAAEVRPMPGAPVLDSLVDLEPVSARIAVTPLVLKGQDPRGEAVLRHEVTHVALALSGEGPMSTWLVEGMAEYVAYRSTSGGKVSGTGSLARRGLPEQTWAQLRRGTWKPLLDQLPGLFYTGDTQKVSDEYTSGWFACLYIASHYGEKKLFALYAAQASASRDLNATDVEARTLKSVLGIDRATLIKQTSAFARDVRRSFA